MCDEAHKEIDVISCEQHERFLLDKVVKKIFDLFNEYPNEYEAEKLQQIITEYVKAQIQG